MYENETNDPWAEYEINEGVDESDKKQAESMLSGDPVGLFLCTISGSKPGDFSGKYSCPVAKIQFTINEVIELEQPAVDKEGNPVKVDGKPKMIVRKLNDDNVIEANALHSGRLLFDDIRCYGVGESEFMKKRRIAFLLCTGVNLSKGITTQTFAKDIIDQQIVVRTVHNSYESNGQLIENVKVDFFNGYAHVNTVKTNDDDVEI